MTLNIRLFGLLSICAGMILLFSCGRDHVSDPSNTLEDNTTSSIKAPTELVATAAGTSAIDLTWKDNSDNEDGFKIERSLSSGGEFMHVAVVTTDINSFTENGLDDNTQYYYRVMAYNLSGTSKPTNIASAITDEGNNDDGIPDPILNFLDTQPLATGIQNEITLQSGATYDLTFLGENFEVDAKVVFKFNGAIKFELENDGIHLHTGEDDVLDVDDIPAENFEEIGTWSAYVKNGEGHISAELTFTVIGETFEFRVEPQDSGSQTTVNNFPDGLTGGTYEIAVDEDHPCERFGWCENFADQDNDDFCFNVEFNGVKFYDDYATSFDEDYLAYQYYINRKIEVTISQGAHISALFHDLVDGDYWNNEGRLYFTIQRIK